MADISKMDKRQLGKLFDQSIIGNYSDKEVAAFTEKAVAYNMRGVFPATIHYMDIVKDVLKGTEVWLGGNGGGFPMGFESPSAKAFNAQEMVDKGAVSIDMAMNYAALLSGRYHIVEEEVRLLRKVADGLEAKMIIEVCLLNDQQIRDACQICIQGGLNFVKSSTGQIQGPTMEQVCIILDACKGTDTKCKVAGVKFPRSQNAMAFLLAGVERIGTQRAAEILDGVDLLRERGIIPPYQS